MADPVLDAGVLAMTQFQPGELTRYDAVGGVGEKPGDALMRWVRKKYKRLRPARKARERWEYVTTTYPRYFAHWAQVTNPLMIKTTGAV